MPVKEMTLNIGGGGCPANMDILVDELPFDFLQPVMRRQVVQAGYGGPFVIRSNPIGAILDAIRGFCFPVPMEMSSDGGVYSDLSGSGLGSPGDYTAPPLGYDSGGYPGLGGGGGFSNPFNPMANGAASCGAGTMWDGMACVPIDYSSYCGPSTMYDPTTKKCVPIAATGANTPADSCDPANYGAAAQASTVAIANKDWASLCMISTSARACQNSPNISPVTKAAWKGLADYTKVVLAGVGINDCSKVGASPMPAPMSMGMVPMPMAPGGNTPMTPPATMNPNTPSGTSDTMPGAKPGPFGYISAADQALGKAGTTTKVAVKAFARQTRWMPPMPNMPDPMSLTEGNLGMMASANPLGGSFDPGRIQGRERVITTPGRAATSSVGRVFSR